MYKIICKACRKWLWTTEKSEAELGSMNGNQVYKYFRASPEFVPPSGSDLMCCPNCGADLTSINNVDFEILIE